MRNGEVVHQRTCKRQRRRRFILLKRIALFARVISVGLSKSPDEGQGARVIGTGRSRPRGCGRTPKADALRACCLSRLLCRIDPKVSLRPNDHVVATGKCMMLWCRQQESNPRPADYKYLFTHIPQFSTIFRNRGFNELLWPFVVGCCRLSRRTVPKVSLRTTGALRDHHRPKGSSRREGDSHQRQL